MSIRWIKITGGGGGGGSTINDIAGLQAALDSKLSAALLGAPNGIAQLGSDGKLHSAQTPEGVSGGGGGSAPTVSVAPTVSGTANQGETLTRTQGTYANTPTSVTGQWQLNTGSGWTNINGQTGATLTVPATTAGHQYSYLETATNASGSVQSRSNVLTTPSTGVGPLQSGDTIRVLWVGNSLTDTAPEYNNYALGGMGERLKPMLAELGVTLINTERFQGGAEFTNHAANSTTMTEIANSVHDVVNLQSYYVGFGSAASYQTAVTTLYNQARSAGSDVLFEGMWSYRGDPGSPQHPTAALAVEGAADAMTGAFAVQVGRVWHRISELDNALWLKLYGDNTHQSALGEYLNALVYTRFFTGQSVAGITSASSLVTSTSTVSERNILKGAVDEIVDRFYQRAAAVTLNVTISAPTEDQQFNDGDTVTFTASAIDSSTGDISNTITWLDSQDNVLHTGASFTATPAVAQHTVRARATSSVGEVVTATRTYRVVGAGNTAPTVSNVAASVPFNSPFTQVNLSAAATDLESSVDWSTLQLDTTGFDGVTAVQNGVDAFTVDFDYSNGFSGADQILWRVADTVGLYSAWAQINLDVQAGSTEPVPTVTFAAATRAEGQTLAQADANWTRNGDKYDVTDADDTWRANNNGYTEDWALYNVSSKGNQAIEVTRLVQADDDGYQEMSLILRGQATGTNGYRIYITGGTTGVTYLMRNNVDQGVDGVGTPGTRARTNVNIKTTQLKLRATIEGGRIRVYANDVLYLDWTDPSPLPDGNPGLTMYCNGWTSRIRLSEIKVSA